MRHHRYPIKRYAKGTWDRPKLPPRPPLDLPEACGATTRAGTPCKRRDIYASGRCRLHGGLSTGPRTPEGKAKSALNGLKAKRRRQ